MTKDMQATAASLILWLRDNMTFGKGYAGEPDIDRVTDDSKVTDHHAIIPTVEIARTDLSELPSGERDVLTLLVVRLLVPQRRQTGLKRSPLYWTAGDILLRQKERPSYSPAGKRWNGFTV